MLTFIKNMIEDKKEYRNQMARVEALPEEYRFVFQKIQNYMWNFASGDGLDMLKTQYDLIELFETAVAENKPVLEITGEDVAYFCDELMRGNKQWKDNYRTKINNDIMDKIGKK